MNSSISRRLVLWLAIPLMLLALCGALLHYYNSVAPGLVASDRRLHEATAALRAHLVVRDRAASLEDALAPPPLPAHDAIRYALRGPEGALLLGDPALPAASSNEAGNPVPSMARCGDRSCRALTTRFEAGDEVVLLTVADLLPTAEPVARYGLFSTLLSDFVQLDLTLVLVWIGIQFGLRPVLRLRDEIAARSPNDLRAINAESVPRELAPIVVTLNRLFALLRYSVESQQQFIANTAHQVRTPITGIQAQLNLLVAEPAAEPVKARLLTLQDGVRQLAHAANQLLSLARADPSLQIATRRQPVELQRLVGEVATRFFDRALECGIDLGVDLKPATLLADPALIDDLCANLVDNALKYTPAGGTVTVSTGEAAGRPFLVVEDSGPGIPVAERQRVRQRFYRLPHTPGHGSGLGLAIVDEIATLYDATLSIDSGAAGSGTRVTVQFANPGWGSRAS